MVLVRRSESARFLWLALCFASILFAGGCGSSAADAERLFGEGQYDKALPLWRQRADAGDALAQNFMGVSYHLGLGTGQDYKEAARWYTVAAENGSIDAQRNLGTMYYHGFGVTQDSGLAYGWYYVASKNGNTKAEEARQSMMDEMTPNHCRLSEKRIKEYLQTRGILKRVMVHGQLDE